MFHWHSMPKFSQNIQWVWRKSWFVIFAIFSNGGHLGYSTWPNFIILRPWSQVMLHVKFDIPCQNSAKISNGSGEKVDIVIFAIFSNGGHLGYSTWPNFIILRPWSQVMLHVKFDIPCQNSAKISNGSGEKVDIVIFAIFSNGGHLGYSTWPNFIILRPWSQVMLHVKFDIPCQNSAKISNGSGEKVDIVIFAIFSNGGHLGYSTWPNFIILRPWSQVMLHVKFDIPCQNSAKISNGSGEKVDIVIFAIFSNGGHLGYSTRLNFIILRPWSQVMLHIKFEKCRCNSFIEKRYLNICFQVLTNDAWRTTHNGV